MKNIRDCLGMGDNSGLKMSRLRSTAKGGLALISEERCYSCAEYRVKFTNYEGKFISCFGE